MTTPGTAEVVLDAQVLDDVTSRRPARWGGSPGRCHWMTSPSAATRRAAAGGTEPAEADEGARAVREAKEPAQQPPTAVTAEDVKTERPGEERPDEPEPRQVVETPEATRARATKPARARPAKKVETARPARTRGTKKR